MRIRYLNEVGWSKLSLPYAAAVPAELGLPDIAIPTEPVPVAPLTVPIPPSHVADVTEARPHLEWMTLTGDTVRRLGHSRSRRSSSMRWEHLSDAEKDTLIAFLEARTDAVEGFATSDPVHGTRTWFIRQGRYELMHTAPGVWTIEAEADEVYAARFFTVAVSQVAGPDVIR